MCVCVHTYIQREREADRLMDRETKTEKRTWKVMLQRLIPGSARAKFHNRSPKCLSRIRPPTLSFRKSTSNKTRKRNYVIQCPTMTPSYNLLEKTKTKSRSPRKWWNKVQDVFCILFHLSAFSVLDIGLSPIYVIFLRYGLHQREDMGHTLPRRASAGGWGVLRVVFHDIDWHMLGILFPICRECLL